MTRRAIAYSVAALCAAAAALALPALGQAASGGGGLSGSGVSQSSGSQGAGSGATHAGNIPVSASGGGISIQTRSSAFLANGLHFSGTAPSQDAGRTLVIERSGHETNWAWTATVQTRINGNGSFSAVWETNHIGQFAIRAVLASGRNGAADASSSSGWPTVNVIVYRPSVATLVRRQGRVGLDDRVRRGAPQQHARGRQPHPPVRHEGGALLPGPIDHGARDRPRALRAAAATGI